MARWECAIQEVRRHVIREEYDRQRKDGVSCTTELDAVMASSWAVRSAVADGRCCSNTITAAARRQCDKLEETVAAGEHSGGRWRVRTSDGNG